jgi:hypothetical protein
MRISKRGIGCLGCLGFSILFWFILYHVVKWIWIAVVR